MGENIEERLLDEFEYLLKTFDWSYQYSDDHGVWRRGRAHAEAIANKFKELNDHSLELYKKADALYEEYKNGK